MVTVPSLTKSALLQEVSRVTWWHHIDLGHGIVTPGADEKSSVKLRRMHLPEMMTGKTVLDVGAWDGYFSFESERRGASRVLATDYFCWGHGGWGSKSGFELARSVLGSKVEDRDIDAMDLSRETLGEFDIVLFLGVFYHLKNPLAALERIAGLTRELLIVESHADMLFAHRPAMAFYEGSELNGDPTNWWGPNAEALMAVLRAFGFNKVEVVWQRSLGMRLARALKQRVQTGAPFVASLQQGRVCVHAYR